MIKFGPSGPSERFYLEGGKGTEEVAVWVKNQGLDLFEYSFGHGVNVKEDKALSIRNAFKNADVKISVHAPYYINFANPSDEKATNSYNYVIESAKMAKLMGAERVVFHPASQGKEAREIAVGRTAERLKILADIIREEGLDDLIFCPETMGKVVQIGDIAEITEFCKIADFYLPTVDFGHINAREGGSLKTADDFALKMQYLIDRLGYERIKNFHVHFSKIQYSSKGEIRHLNFDDQVYGPNFEPFIDACLKLGLTPDVICESSGNQADDAVTMKNYYLSKV